MRDMPNYEEIIETEKRASARLKELANQMANECQILWHWGDGQGAHIFETVRNAFTEGGAWVCSPTPSRRKKMPASTKTFVFERDAYRCVKCNSYEKLCIDHIYPHSRGGSDDPENLQTLCWKCNSKKADKLEVSQ